MSYLVSFCSCVLLALRLPGLGKREVILLLFVRLFDLCLFGFVGFFLLVSGKGCVCDCGTPWTFLLPFFSMYMCEKTVMLILKKNKKKKKKKKKKTANIIKTKKEKKKTRLSFNGTFFQWIHRENGVLFSFVYSGNFE